MRVGGRGNDPPARGSGRDAGWPEPVGPRTRLVAACRSRSRARDADARGGNASARAGSGDGRQLQVIVGHMPLVGQREVNTMVVRLSSLPNVEQIDRALLRVHPTIPSLKTVLLVKGAGGPVLFEYMQRNRPG